MCLISNGFVQNYSFIVIDPFEHSYAILNATFLFQVVDLLVLFILHSTNANHSRRGAERVLKVKVRKGLIQESLLQKTFKGHAQVCFPSHAYD